MRYCLTSVLISVLWLSLHDIAFSAPQENLTSLERQFRELPMEAKRLTGPLFWLHGEESRERLEMYVGKVAEGGNGCFTAESRPHVDWLGEGWWRDLTICLDAAKKHNLKMWIFDEKWWPSQGIGGAVPPRYAAKLLKTASVDLEGPRTYDAEGYAGEHYVAALAGRLTADGKIDGSTLLDLASSIHDGKLSWQVPAGKWKVMKFIHIQAPSLSQNGQLSIDGASRDCVDWFIQKVYQPHFDHYGADFGKTIPGFFYDEPETRGDWGTELNRILAEWKVDWKKAYAAYKFELAGEEQIAARYQYLDAFAEAWGRTMYGGMTRWCHEHGVKSIGHFIEHGGMYHDRGFCAGDMMRLQGYSDMGGIDAVFSQFIIGKREEAADHPIWQTPKLGSSISHVYGKQDDVAMVEIFGARGQDLTYSEMKWWTDHMQVSGVNFMIPHSFNPKSPYDTDCPPYFYNGGFEPRWPLYRVYADYSSRLSLMLSGGRHVCPVALLFMGQSAQVGRFVPPEDFTTALQDGQIDCDWLPYEVFERKTKISAKELLLHQERYKVLVVPPVEVIPYPVLAKVKAYFEAGGVVVGYGFLPTKSATLGHSSKEIVSLCESIWGEYPGKYPDESRIKHPNQGQAFFLSEKPTAQQLQQLFADAGIRPGLKVLEGETNGWLHLLHRQKAGQDIFLVCNQNHQGAARQFKFRANAVGEPECWDAMRNEVTAIPFQRMGQNTVEFSLSLEPLESVLIVFQPKGQPRPTRIDPNTKPIREPIIVPRDPNPIPPEPVVKKLKSQLELPLSGCKWVWFPEGDPAAGVPAGTRYFRQTIAIPTDRKIKQAQFYLTADNSFECYVNGKPVGAGSAYNQVITIDMTKHVQPGLNALAVAATNGSDQPNPAGLIGRFTVEFEQGPPLEGRIDKTWKTSQQKQEGWTNVHFDVSKWVPSLESVEFGKGPWGSFQDRQLAVSPVAAADPFRGRFTIPTDIDRTKCRVFLEMKDLPDDSAAVSINGAYAGGVIGRPGRLDITRCVKPGENKVFIEPLTPKSVRIVIY